VGFGKSGAGDIHKLPAIRKGVLNPTDAIKKQYISDDIASSLNILMPKIKNQQRFKHQPESVSKLVAIVYNRFSGKIYTTVNNFLVFFDKSTNSIFYSCPIIIYYISVKHKIMKIMKIKDT
jgi:hypothetical protein